MNAVYLPTPLKSVGRNNIYLDSFFHYCGNGKTTEYIYPKKREGDQRKRA